MPSEPCAICGQMKDILNSESFEYSNSKAGNVCKECWNKADDNTKLEYRKKYDAYYID
ncbi:MAG: hypothetical protein ACFFDB_00095 [Promethearchaeota archaeon]